MRKMLIFATVMALGLMLATPVLADYHGHYRGHPGRYVRGGYHSSYYAPYPRPRFRSRFFFGFGAPIYAPAPAYYYRPAPVYAPPCEYPPVWVPGHYVYEGGGRFWIEGMWSR